jgi:hypothetical protein
MAGRLGALLALGLLVCSPLSPVPATAQAVPPGATAISMLYKPPATWGRMAPSATAASVYVVRDGDKVHTLIFQTVSPKTAGDPETYAADQIAAQKTKGAEITDEGATTVCEGQAAHRWSMLTASSGTAVRMHVLAVMVTGGVATAIYTHREDVGDRRDALDAMETLCPGPIPSPVPAGWTAPKSRVPSGGTGSLDSPDATSTFVTTYRPIKAEDFGTFEHGAVPSGAVLADHRDPCGTGTVHRVDVQVGGQIAEVSVAYLHHGAYKYVYTRPAAHEADAGAERALTAFCRALSPVSAASATPS